jgi:hypothetical protein
MPVSPDGKPMAPEVAESLDATNPTTQESNSVQMPNMPVNPLTE